MTYCLGMLFQDGLVLGSDSRTNAGVDQIATVRKLATFVEPGERMIAIQTAGNLATTQAVVTELRQAWGSGFAGLDMKLAPTLFEVARIVGDKLRAELAREESFVRPYGDPGATLLVSGQISGEAPRLFQIYTAGNFIEASPRTQFLQIGETKYGKPILDRALRYEMDLCSAATLALLSYDATIRSNLSVGPPIDLLIYEANSFSDVGKRKFTETDPFWINLRHAYASGLEQLVNGLPIPDRPGIPVGSDASSASVATI